MAVIASGKPPVEPAALLASPASSPPCRPCAACSRDRGSTCRRRGTADASIVAHRADGVVMVVRAEATPRDQVASAVRALSGAPVWGLVLNGVDPARVPQPLPVVKGQLTSGK